MKGLVVTAIGCLAMSVGCGTSTRTLTATDVSNIPPGTAVGTALSGAYLIVSESIDGCDCRVGSCSNIKGEIGAVFEVTQQDGVLTMTDSADVTNTTLTGSVDVNDTYSCGGVAQIPSYLGSGVAYLFQTGVFQVSGGQPTGMQFQADETLTATVLGSSLDCDFHASGSARYEGY